MMESLEQKNVTSVSEEPAKPEEQSSSPDTERSNNASSPPPNCSICLGKLVNKSFTDSCLHQFCFHCLLQWSKIKTECPLCKQVFKSIIHNVRSEEDYDQYNVPISTQVAATLDVTAARGLEILRASISLDQNMRFNRNIQPFMYRTTLAPRRYAPSRFYSGLLNAEAVARREQLPNFAPINPNEDRRTRNRNPLNFRRNVYHNGLLASPLPSYYGPFKECTAEYYRQNPSEINRLIPWINRELQVLLSHNPAHQSYVMNVILNSITQYGIQSDAFRDNVRAFFGVRTNQFVHELFHFARTNFDVVGYDRAVEYSPSNGLSREYVPRVISPSPSDSSGTSQDSDVRVMDDAHRFRITENSSMPSMGPLSIDRPGPSTVAEAFQVPIMGQMYNINPGISPDVLTISSSSEGECEVVGYVKPRHERTPEIIDLSSSEADVPQPSTSQENQTINLENSLIAAVADAVLDAPSYPSTSYDITDQRRASRKAELALKAQMYELCNSSTDSESDNYRSSRVSRANGRKKYKKKSRSTKEKSSSKLSKSTSSRKSQESKKTKKGTKKSDREKSARKIVSSNSESDCSDNWETTHKRHEKAVKEKRKLNKKAKSSSPLKRGKRKNSGVSSKSLRSTRRCKRLRSTSNSSSSNSSHSSTDSESTDVERKRCLRTVKKRKVNYCYSSSEDDFLQQNAKSSRRGKTYSKAKTKKPCPKKSSSKNARCLDTETSVSENSLSFSSSISKAYSNKNDESNESINVSNNPEQVVVNGQDKELSVTSCTSSINTSFSSNDLCSQTHSASTELTSLSSRDNINNECETTIDPNLC